MVTNSAGTMIELNEYKPFGGFSRHDQFGTSNAAWYYFTGKPLDDETGLMFYGARYYSPVLGKFITPDLLVQAPTNPQTLNRYTYCNNNPINLIDNDGHKWSWKKFFHAAIGAIIGTALAIFTGPAGVGWFTSAWAAGAFGGAVGGAITGGLDGGWKGALVGGAIGGVLGGLGSWGAGIAKAHQMTGQYVAGMLAAGAGVAAATDGWDSFAGGLVGGIASGVASNGYVSSHQQEFASFRAGRGFTKAVEITVKINDVTTPAPQKSGLIDQLKQVIGAGLTAVEEYQKQWAATIKAEASGWTKGLARAQFLSKGAMGIGLMIEASGYVPILQSGTPQMGLALTVHTGAIVGKMAVTGVGAFVGGWIGTTVFPGVGTTYGATVGAVGLGYFGSNYIDGLESSYLNSIGIKQ